MYIIEGIAYAGEPSACLRVTDARVVNDLCMLVQFSTGETRLFDAAPLLQKDAFKPLSDENIFNSFTIDHGLICWDNGEIDLAPEAIYSMSYEYSMAA